VRLLGGARYWPYGIEQVSDCCRRRGIALAVLPGDDQPDPELTALSTLEPPAAHRLWQYCVQGGPVNARNLLFYAASLIGRAGMARARHAAARRTLLARPVAADAR
jgi:cobaltochelatase CobN